jgi:serine kinase of HPr protein (carbohydrate metabolism regulator)
VVLAEGGILICGESGAGKSALALALIELGGALGCFARLIGDDRIQICVEGGRIVMGGAPNVAGLIERRGVGLARMAFEPAAVAHLVVELLPAGAKVDRLPEAASEVCEIAGVRLPRIAFDESSSPQERARAILFKISRIGERFVTAIDHFA